MIVTVILAGEAGFWAVLALALAARYLLGLRRLSTALLLGLPLIDLAVLAASALDLRGGATASWTHGLAALYLGFSVAYGGLLVRWADGHAAHRFAGGPKPLGAPKYGRARTVHEWKICARTLVAAGLTAALVAVMSRVAGDCARSGALDHWYFIAGRVAAVSLVVAGIYSFFPPKPPAGAIVENGRVVGRQTPRTPSGT